MKIALDIEEGDIERIVRSRDNQHAYLRSTVKAIIKGAGG
jgi:hypothetical protein